MREWAYILLGYLIVTSESDVVTSLDTASLLWPVVVLDGGVPLPGRGGSVITQEWRPPMHMGVDIAVPGKLRAVRAQVRAVARGRVVRAYRGERGWAVLVDHDDWASGYLHLGELHHGIADGAIVAPGQILGTMGADPLDPERILHLHFQLAPGGHAVDPARYLTRAT